MDSSIGTFRMIGGRSIPLIGLGTYLLEGKQVLKVLDEALSVGYRAFDTAVMYCNEKEIGSALKELLPKHNLKRDDIFITSKLYPSDHGDGARDAVAVSLNNLQCDYLDLYLIHWPGAYGISSRSTQNLQLRTATWASLVNAQDEGLVKDIGVSNYTVTHLNQLLANCYGVKPVLNQIEWHPACHDDEVKHLCDSEGILVQGYMPFGGSGNSNLLQNKVVVDIAKKLGKSPAQVLLRWCLQQNVAVIPKASSREHLLNNLDVNFVIPEEDMVQLKKTKPAKYDWDPKSVL